MKIRLFVGNLLIGPLVQGVLMVICLVFADEDADSNGSTGTSPLCGTLNVHREYWYQNATFLITFRDLEMTTCLDRCCKNEECAAVMFTGFLTGSNHSHCYLQSCFEDSCNTLAWKPADTGLLTIHIARNDAYLENLHNYSSLTASASNTVIYSTTPPPQTSQSAGQLSNLLLFNNATNGETGSLFSSTKSTPVILYPENQTNDETDTSKVEKADSGGCVPYSLLGVMGCLLIVCILVIFGLLCALLARKSKASRGTKYRSRSYNDHLDAYNSIK